MTSIDPRDRFGNLSDALVIVQELESIELALARESLLRCLETSQSEFFATLYAGFRKRCPESRAMFEALDQDPARWPRLHGMLNDALLLLFAYAGTPASARGEPNVLSRIAAFHGSGGPLSVNLDWYDHFLAALLEAVASVDPDWKIQEVRPFIRQAWQFSLEPGLRYMKSHCQRGEEAERPMLAPTAARSEPALRLAGASMRKVV